MTPVQWLAMIAFGCGAAGTLLIWYSSPGPWYGSNHALGGKGDDAERVRIAVKERRRRIMQAISYVLLCLGLAAALATAFTP